MSISQLKRAIKAAEKARSAWDGIGEIPVTYDALCELRAQLTTALIDGDIAARQVAKQAEADERFWDGIHARVEARRADGLNEVIADKLIARMLEVA